MKALAIITFVLTFGASAPVFAEPIGVKFTEGVSHAFPVLRSVGGEKLAQGELTQIPRGDCVENRLTFRFRDGSLYDERVVFSQKDTFTLMSYQIVQKGKARRSPSRSTRRWTAKQGATRSATRVTRR